VEEHATRPSGACVCADPIPADLGARVRRFVAEARDLARRHLLAWLGVSPAALDLAEVAASSPELERALRDPAVRALLRDRRNSRELADLLFTAARHAASDPHVN
jgi:hypothetical protein